MKKIKFLFLLFTISILGLKAQNYNYHRFETYTTKELACEGNSSNSYTIKINLDIDRLLPVGNFYIIDLGSANNLGVRYCKVLNRYNGTGDADLTLNNPNIGYPQDVCDFSDNKYHRFATFKTLTKAKNNKCESANANDGIYKVNLKINNLLEKNKFYMVDLGNGLGIRYCKVLNRYDSKGDADFNLYGGNIGNPITINCPSNTDGDADTDGIPDNQDNCPNEAGPASNNGCPGNPELAINLNGSSIVSNCFSCDVFFSQIGSDRHFLYANSGSANLNILVNNSGNSSSNATKVGIYVSADNVFQSNSDSKVKSFDLEAISPGQSKESSGSLLADDFDVTTNFWLLIRIDDDETNDETDESNNVFAIRFNANTPL